jgi:exodeoxyribonuclease VII small subunit
MSTSSEASGELSFSQAMEELESVLRRIEGDEVDIDLLGRELGRAAELLEICRKKIRRAEVEVQQIVEAIEEDADSGDAAVAPGEASDLKASAGDGGGNDDIPF